MHRGIGDFAVALFIVFRVFFFEGNEAAQRFAVVGQLLEYRRNFACFRVDELLNLVVSKVKVETEFAVVAIACGLHGFVVGDDASLQCGQDFRQSFAA